MAYQPTTNPFYKGNQFLPKAGNKKNVSDYEINEAARCMDDPCYFAEKYFKIVHQDAEDGIIPLKLFQYQRESIERFVETNRLLMATARQVGKVEPSSNRIPLASGGFTTMGDIQVGYQVIGSDGKPATVTYKTEQLHFNTMRVSFDDGSHVDVGEEHLWTVVNRINHRKIETKNTKRLAQDFRKLNNRGYYEYRYLVNNCKPVDYVERHYLIDPYVLGAWLGDGSKSDGKFTCHVDHKTYYEQQGIEFSSEESYERNSNSNVFTSTITGLASKLRAYNLLDNKHIPDDFLFGSIDQRLAILQGLMDTDGHVRDNGMCEIQLTDRVPQLVESVYQLLTSLGIKVFRSQFFNNRFKEPTSSTRLTFTPPCGMQVVRMPSKAERLKSVRPRENYTNSRSIVNIELIGEDVGHCIQVDSPDHLYLTSHHYIPTHNTTVATVLILWVALFNKRKNIALLADKEATAIEVLDRIKTAYEYLPDFLKGGVLEWNKKSVTFENRSKIIASATSSNAIRGKSIFFLYIDEAAHVEDWDTFAAAVLPTVSASKKSKIVLTSCVTDDTYLWTDKGLQQIGELVDYNRPSSATTGYTTDPYRVVGFDGVNDGRVVVNSGLATVNHLTTTHSELSCSQNHKIYSYVNGQYGWHQSSQLAVGDYVAIRYGFNHWLNQDSLADITLTPDHRRTNKFVVPEQMTEDLAYVLGLYTAEGNITNNAIDITCGDTIEVTDSIRRIGLPVVCYDGLRHRISSADFVELMGQLGFNGKDKAVSKHIPVRITAMSREIIAAYLRGIFDGDGHACETNGQVRVGVTSISRTLIEQIRSILQNMGILSQVYAHPPAVSYRAHGRHIAYQLEIYGEHVGEFKRLVGFDLARKREVLDRYVAKRVSGKDVIPGFFDLKKHYGWRLKSGQSRLKTQRDLSRAKAIQYVGDAAAEIISPNIKWDRIKSISQSTELVYDVSLDHIEGDPWCHSVLYNGIVGHQTPNGMNHFYNYYEAAKNKISEYPLIEVPWWKVEGRDEAWKQKTLADLNYNHQKFAQEQEVEFLGSSGTLISGGVLKVLEKKVSLPVHSDKGLRMYQPVQRNAQYLMICDVSRGKNLDYNAFHVIDISKQPYQQVCVYHNNETNATDYAAVIDRIGRYYNDANVLVELNDNGGAVIDLLFMYHGYENLLMTQTNGVAGKQLSSGFGGKNIDRGIRTTQPVRQTGCAMIKMVIEQEQLLIADTATVNELKTFSAKKTPTQHGSSALRYEAEPGKHDDLVMGLVLFGWLVNQPYFKAMTDMDVLQQLRMTDEEELEDQLLPFGIINSGMGDQSVIFEEASDPGVVSGNQFDDWLKD